MNRVSPTLIIFCLLVLLVACTRTIDSAVLNEDVAIDTQANFNVNSPADSNDVTPGDGLCADVSGFCTLRAAIQETNAFLGPDSITLAAGTYNLSIFGSGEDTSVTGDLDISEDLSIMGAGQDSTFIDASSLSGTDRVLHILSGATVKISKLTVTGGGGSLFAENGGGIFNNGNLSLSSSTVSSNSSQYDGGGIFNNNPGLLELSNTTVSNNSAQLGGGILNDFEGVVILNNSRVSTNIAQGVLGLGGGIYNNEGRVILELSSVSDNVAEGSGGGLYNVNGLSLLMLMDSTVNGNTAQDFGAGVFNRATATIHDSRISSNNAVLDGGGILNSGSGTFELRDSTVANNSARRGGGISHESGKAVLSAVTIRDNVADSSGISRGGGIYNAGMLDAIDLSIIGNHAQTDGGGVDNSFGTLNLSDSRITGNTAARGAGINNEFGTASLSNTIINGNTATSSGGGVNNDGFAGGDELSIIRLENSTIEANNANSGGGIYNNGGDSSVTLSGSRVINNDRYGVQNNDSAVLYVSNSTISNNVLSGILNDFDALATVQQTLISNNTGIGVEVPQGSVDISDSSIRDNGGDGMLSDGTVTLTASTVSGNGRHGIFNDAGALNLVNSTISGNSQNGIVNENSVSASHVSIVNNGSYGINNGAIGSDTVNLINSILVGNGIDCNGNISSSGYNLDSDASCALTAMGDIASGKAALDMLADNGGFTQTHALGLNSDALNQIPNGANGCGSTFSQDQRGVMRPQSANCDMGAFELESAGDIIIYVSSSSSGSVEGVRFRDEDILSYDFSTERWSLYFDGSDVGLSSADINALELMDDGSLLFSLRQAGHVRDVGAVDDSDILKFIPSSLGIHTSGSFELYFDGSDFGLSKDNEDLDAIGFTPDGRLVISTNGSFVVDGLSGKDEDLIVFNGSLGETTVGSFEVYFDGSDINLTTSEEDLYGLWIEPTSGELYLTTRGDFVVPDLGGQREDLFVFVPTGLGENTRGDASLFWKGSDHGFIDERIDGLFIDQ